MRIYYCFLFLCSFLLMACKTEQPEFPKEEVLTPELMPLQGITSPFFLDIKSPFLIVQNDYRQRTDSIFHIYDLNSYELKSVFGLIGRGPSEFLDPGLFSAQLSDFLIVDMNIGLAYFFGINKDGSPTLNDSKKSNYIHGIGNAAFINDSLFVTDEAFYSPYMHLLSFQDELPRKSWQFRNPAIINGFIDPDYGKVYANNDRIIFCYYFKKQIDFMDIEFNLFKRVKFDYVTPSITQENQSIVNQSYIAGYLGKRYLYALFMGVPWKDGINLSFRESILEVFDLDGNPVIKYRLDGLPPTSFVVDEEIFTLYGCREDGEPEDHLLVYKLKGLQ